MKKTISVPLVIYEMLVEVSRKVRKKPEQWLEEQVKEHYKKV